MEMLLTVEQAAQRLQVTRYTVRQHLREGRLRGIKRGRDWRIPESALIEPVAQHGAGGKQPESPLGRALEMVRAMDAQNPPTRMRTLGVDDVATEIRQMREAEIP